ncbi:MAG: M50 family metallopeptidase [Candidatus Omnitrophica bacterium]|nr:M50 family metallopeptidase [Candidatus Omnitrophota bacterium]
MIASISRTVLGVLLLPALAGFAFSFYEQLLAIHQVRKPELLFLFGITIYLAFHVLVTAPNRAYVFGHEMMHAVAAWLTGGQVKGFKAGSKKGAVTTNKVTGVVALAPYLVPVYAILWALVYVIVGLFEDVEFLSGLFYLGLGAALTFHLVYTVLSLKQKQTDLEVLGPLISLNFILWGNISFVILVIALMAPEVGFWNYIKGGFLHAGEFYKLIFHQLFM